MAFGVDDLLLVGLPLLGKLFGDALSSGDKAEAERLRGQILEQYGPEALQQAIKDAQVGKTEFENYQADPQAMAAQRLALQRLQEDAATTGLTAPERAELGQAMDETAQYERGQRGAILQDAQARGVGGSGLELAQQLLSQQGGATRAAAFGRDAAAAAAKRRALAGMQLGQFGGQLRGQGFEEFGSKARAQDAINQFNAANTRALGSEFRSGRSGALSDQAAAKEGRAQDTQKAWAGVGAAGTEALSSFYNPETGKWEWR